VPTNPATSTPIAPGTGPRNPFTGAGTKTMDLSLTKNFKFAERYNFQLQGQFFNLMNTPQFNQPDGKLEDATTCPASGVFNGAPCTPWTIVSQGTFGEVTTLRYASEREIQVSLRFTF